MPETQGQAGGSLGPAVVYFAKVPAPGRVKSRLCPPLTHAEAAGLYRGFLQDALVPVPGARTYLFGWPESELAALGPLTPPELVVRPQRGRDLWERMRNCFAELFAAGHDRVVLRNTDSPDLPVEIVQRAVAAAIAGRVVLGPDTGGGYYLIGLGSAEPELFGVAGEGGATVLDATIECARARGLEVELLPIHRDVDTFDDLLALWRERGGG